MRGHTKFIVWCAVVLVIGGAATFYAVGRHRSGDERTGVQVVASHGGKALNTDSAMARTARSVSAQMMNINAAQLNPSKVAFGPLDSADLRKFAAVFEGQLRKYDPNATKDIPVFDAVLHGNTAKLGEYLDSGGNPNLTAQYSPYDNSESLLVEAVNVGQRAIVAELIARGANVNFNPGGINNTPLVVAAQEGEGDVVIELLNHGANIEQMNGVGITAMHAAVLGGNYATVKLLLDQGAGINTALTPDGRVPPYVANSTEPNLVAIKKLLMAHGALPWDPVSAGASG